MTMPSGQSAWTFSSARAIVVPTLTPFFGLGTIKNVVREFIAMAIASDMARPTGARGFWLGFAAYLLPSFPIAFVWHLVLFEQKYHALKIYRDEPVIAFGLASMIIQGGIFSWMYPRVFVRACGTFLKVGVLYGLDAGPSSWYFTSLSVASTDVMVSVPDYVLLETAFTVLQFAVVGPLIALAWRR